MAFSVRQRSILLEYCKAGDVHAQGMKEVVMTALCVGRETHGTQKLCRYTTQNCGCFATRYVLFKVIFDSSILWCR